jgi:aspartyl-tRNA(Asn)/glutamyl-tRNA(Gln) amidotransferase subunit A
MSNSVENNLISEAEALVAAPSSETAESADLAGMSLSEASAAIASGKVTPTQLVQACLNRIDRYNPEMHAYVTVLKESALAQAKVLEEELHAGKTRGPLHGIPIALKDNIDTAGIRTTAGSAVFDDRYPKEDAEVARKLKAAGAIVLGKANMHEFAFGGTSSITYFGAVRNPWSFEHNTGGSSGGSAAAVAADLCFAALGTDTGGSVRIPASFCGVVGLKATYGLVSIRGIIPDAFSLDHCGPITRTVEDAAIMLNAMTGYDKLDIASVQQAKEDYVQAMKQPVSGLRIGVPRAPFFDHADPEVAQAVEDAIAVVAKLTAGVNDVSLPRSDDFSWDALNAETYAWHQELYQTSLNRYMLATRQELQGMKDWIDDPSRACSHTESDYVRMIWDLQTRRRVIDEKFTDFDLVVLPSMRVMPRTVANAIEWEEKWKPRNPDEWTTENMEFFNLYGIPAISVPCGFNKAGLPIGLMIGGPPFSEGRVLALAAAYERATEWHKRRPPLKA